MPSNAAFANTSPDRSAGGRARLGRCLIVLAAAAATVSIVGVGKAAAANSHGGDGRPDFGPNVVIFDPSMPTSQIQATVDSIANQQVSNQFGTQRYALLFKPGTYGTAADPLNFQVGYYTEVAGLGSSPDDVVINGSVDVYNQCAGGQLHRAEQLLALAVEPDDQRDQPRASAATPASSGRCPRPRRCGGSTSTGSPRSWTTARVRRSRAAASSPTRSSTAAP